MRACQPLAVVTVAIACLAAAPPGGTANGERVAFQTSFERPADLEGWTGFGIRELVAESPAQAGGNALRVTGGCLQPQAMLPLPASAGPRKLLVRAVARAPYGSGAVTLAYHLPKWRPDSQVAVFFADSAWREAQSADTLFCPADVPPSLEISAGGFVSGAIVVDRVEVIEVP